MQATRKFLALLAILAVAGCDTDMGRVRHAPAVPSAPVTPPPPPDSNMRPYNPGDYEKGDQLPPPAWVGNAGTERARPHHRLSNSGAERGHAVTCEVGKVDMDKARFICREQHTSWTFHVSPRSDTLGELHQGQHVRVSFSKSRGGYDAEDVKFLKEPIRPAKGN